MMSRLALACVPLVAFVAMGAAPPENPSALDDYPTAARADYVLGCMAANGGTQDALQRCSCSVDIIASILPYKQYVEADTVLRMRQGVGGYLANEFQTAPASDLVRQLRDAQAEAEVRCF
jgi:hypothetical protein